MKWFFGILFGLIFLTILGFGSYAFLIEKIPYSEGTRTGKIIKISKKGIVFKTWEGELSQGLAMSEKFIFSVNDAKVIKDIQKYEGKNNVKLYYEERYAKLFWQGDTQYFVVRCTADNN